MKEFISVEGLAKECYENAEEHYSNGEYVDALRQITRIDDSYLEYSKVEKADNYPIEKDRIIKQITKLGNTPFSVNNIKLDIDENIFISIKELNEIRRQLVNKLIDIRMNTKKEVIINEVSFEKQNIKKDIGITTKVENENQLLEILNSNVKRIYVNDYNLYSKYKNNEKIYYYSKRNSYHPKEEEKTLVSEYYNFNSNNYIIGNYTLNVFNIYTAYYLNKMNIDTITLSVELTEEELEEFIINYKNKFKDLPSLEVLVYGRVENMIIKGNILELNENDKSYNLIDNRNRIFKVYYDGVNTHVLNYEKINIFDNEIIKNNVNLRFDFYDETPSEIKNIVNNY